MPQDQPLQFTIDYQRRQRPSQIGLHPGLAGVVDVSRPVPEEFGTGFTNMVQVQPGLGFARLASRAALDRMKLRMEVPPDSYKITFHDSPDTVEVGIENYKHRILLRRHDSYFLSPAAVGTVFVTPDKTIDETSFLVSPDRLHAVIEDMEQPLDPVLENMLKNPNQVLFPLFGRVTPAMQIVVEQMRCCRMRGNLRYLYLEGKLLEFLALRLQQLRRNRDTGTGRRNGPGIRLTRADRDRLQEARQVLECRMDDPPSIPHLARLVGLNTTKLKRGFHVEFGMTVFRYLHQMRMRKAVMLLLETDLNVSEVAWEVGYSNVSAFSAAFKQEMGFSPSRLQRQGKPAVEKQAAAG
jgi:AraC-like DNA-binding protein